MKKIVMMLLVMFIVSMSVPAFAFGLGNLVSGSLGGGSSSVDVGRLDSSAKNLVLKLYGSTALFGEAVLDLAQAMDYDPAKVERARQSLHNANAKQADVNAQEVVCNDVTAISNDIVNKDFNEKYKNANDEQKEKIRNAVRRAEVKKGAAQIITLWAIPDAINLIQETTSAVGNLSSDLSALGKVNGFLSTAKTAKKLLDEQNATIKKYNATMDEFRKTQGIPDPSQEEKDKMISDKGITKG